MRRFIKVTLVWALMFFLVVPPATAGCYRYRVNYYRYCGPHYAYRVVYTPYVASYRVVTPCQPGVRPGVERAAPTDPYTTNRRVVEPRPELSEDEVPEAPLPPEDTLPAPPIDDETTADTPPEPPVVVPADDHPSVIPMPADDVPPAPGPVDDTPTAQPPATDGADAPPAEQTPRELNTLFPVESANDEATTPPGTEEADPAPVEPDPVDQPSEDDDGNLFDEPTEDDPTPEGGDDSSEPSGDDAAGLFGSEDDAAEETPNEETPAEAPPSEDALPAEDGLFEDAEESDSPPADEENVEDLFGEEAGDAPAADGDAAPAPDGDDAPTEIADDLFDDATDEPAPESDAGDDASSDGATEDDGGLFDDEQASKGLDEVLSRDGGLASKSLRKWIDNTGRFTIQGRLVKIADGQVRILKSTGRTTSVPLARLSATDLAFVQTQAVAMERASLVAQTAQR